MNSVMNMGRSDFRTHSEELYAAYTSGRLDPGFVLLLETQAALRPRLQDELDRTDVIGGALLEMENSAPMGFGALDRAMTALDDETAPVRKAASAATANLKELIRLPSPLQDFALDAAGNKGWQWAGKGLKILNLDVGGATEVELLRIEPGCGAPRHSHRGNEFTLVVSGGFSDERGSYGPGDVSIAGPEDTHQPIADDDGVCFALAVRDGSLKFTGVLGLIQKIMGK